MGEEGDDILITCPFSETPLNDYKLRLLSNRGGSIEIKPTLSGNTPNQLIIPNVTINDGGMYFCQLRDVDNDIYTGPDFKLIVYAKFGK